MSNQRAKTVIKNRTGLMSPETVNNGGTVGGQLDSELASLTPVLGVSQMDTTQVNGAKYQ